MGLNYHNKKLLERFNLSLSCLDYSYIETSNNVKELENILQVLRSGEEGFYPELIKFCECKLNKVSPGNRLLDVTKPVSSFKDLPYEEQELFNSDFKNWVEDIKLQEKELVMTPTREGFENACPIRNGSEMKMKGESGETTKSSSEHKSKASSYEEWNKFDAEKEIENLDKKVSVEQLEESMKKMYGGKVLPIVDTSGLTDKERMDVAEKEKMKGNEYFRTQNYVESLIYYSRSLSAWQSVPALNNRAFAYMKLKNYTSAVMDFDKVLDLEPENVKALYRRGLCYKETGSMQLAFMDFQSALDLDASCKEAKKELAKMDKCPMSKTSSVKSPIIEEVHESSESNSQASVLDSSALSEKKRKMALDNDSQLKAKRTIYYDKKDSSVPASSAVTKSDSDYSMDGGNSKHSTLEEPKVPSVDGANKSSNEDTKKHNSISQTQASGDAHPSTKSIESKNYALQNCGGKCSSTSSAPLKMTPFKFLNLWHSTKASRDSKAGAEILNSISPEKLPSYITNKLDGDILNGLIMSIKEIVNSGDWLKGFEFMKYITNIPRIEIVTSFLSSAERNEISDILLQIEAKQNAEMKMIKETFLS